MVNINYALLIIATSANQNHPTALVKASYTECSERSIPEFRMVFYKSLWEKCYNNIWLIINHYFAMSILM